MKFMKALKNYRDFVLKENARLKQQYRQLLKESGCDDADVLECDAVNSDVDPTLREDEATADEFFSDTPLQNAQTSANSIPEKEFIEACNEDDGIWKSAKEEFGMLEGEDDADPIPEKDFMDVINEYDEDDEARDNNTTITARAMNRNRSRNSVDELAEIPGNDDYLKNTTNEDDGIWKSAKEEFGMLEGEEELMNAEEFFETPEISSKKSSSADQIPEDEDTNSDSNKQNDKSAENKKSENPEKKNVKKDVDKKDENPEKKNVKKDVDKKEKDEAPEDEDTTLEESLKVYSKVNSRLFI